MYVCVYECTIFEGGKKFKPFFFVYIYMYISRCLMGLLTFTVN